MSPGVRRCLAAAPRGLTAPTSRYTQVQTQLPATSYYTNTPHTPILPYFTILPLYKTLLLHSTSPLWLCNSSPLLVCTMVPVVGLHQTSGYLTISALGDTRQDIQISRCLAYSQWSHLEYPNSEYSVAQNIRIVGAE